MAQVMEINRLTLYDWIARGCPCKSPDRAGKPSRMDAHAVIGWRIQDMKRLRFTPQAIAAMRRLALKRYEQLFSPPSQSSGAV